MTVTTIHPAGAADTADTASDGTGTGSLGARPAGAAGAVWDALTANPGATTMTIAKAAGVSRTTAAKALTALEATGQASRTPGAGTGPNKTADTWAAVPADDTAPAATGDVPESVDATEPPSTADTATVTADTVPAEADTATRDGDEASPGAGAAWDVRNAMRILEAEAEVRARNGAELARIQAEEEARRAKIDAQLRAAAVKEETRRALADLLATVTATYAAVISDDEAAVAAGLDKIGAEAAAVRRAAKAPVSRTALPNGSHRTGGGERNAPRPLRPSVEAHLAAHPGKEFTANDIAKVLDRSAGAVANVLDNLTRDGLAELTCEKPRRFRATGTGHTAPAPADTGTGAPTSGTDAAAHG